MLDYAYTLKHTICMNRLDSKTRKQIIAALIEGTSIRATSRMTGVSQTAILKLITDLGQVCDEFQDRAMRHLWIERVQCDEIWGFCYCKDRALKTAKAAPEGAGSVWLWTAVDPDSKLLVTWYIGDREMQSATQFMLDLASRIDCQVQLTTDGLHAYSWAIAFAFEDGKVDYGRLVKLYGSNPDARTSEARYSPGECTGIHKETVFGCPDEMDICTSHVERMNLTIRMSNRRYTRLTNAHSKKLENHAAMVAIGFMHYNFCRKHMSLKGETPAIAAGIADHVWSLDEMIALLPEKSGRFEKIGMLAA
jgi:IS1 family transposase